jgi:hypothetical protein
MNTNIRKDSKVTGHTSSNVLVLGTVVSVDGPTANVLTSAGNVVEVSRASATKLSSAEFKLAVLEATQPTKPSFKVNNTMNKNKKAESRIIFNLNNGQKRKVVIAEFMSNLYMSQACASTYYQNFKSGKWPVA